MSGPKPCLGYPTRTAACLALKAEGLSQTQIAERVGVPSNVVASLLWHGRRVGQPRKRTAAAPPVASANLTDRFTVEERSVLRREAARREMSADRLVQTVIELAIADDLFAAILDDGRS